MPLAPRGGGLRAAAVRSEECQQVLLLSLPEFPGPPGHPSRSTPLKGPAMTDWLPPILLQAAPQPPAPTQPQTAAPGAPPQGGPEQAPNLGDSLRSLFVPFLFMIAIFYFLIWRPEGKKRKERDLMIRNLKKGDTVLTTGGMLGKVWRAEGPEVVLILDKDKDVKVRFHRSAISEVLQGEGLAPEGADARQQENTKPA